jgi:D-serine deaminase-like pyridoxal phosphate-dependent protein
MMERPIFKPVGTPATELDTPALVVDLDVLTHNLTRLHTPFTQRATKLRPHVAIHHCPALAQHQLAAGGTVGGISVATLGQAEVFATHGFTDILVANACVTPAKIRRLCALAQQVTITAAVDHAANVQQLADAARIFDVTLRVAVDVDIGAGRCGVAAGQPALALARMVQEAPHLDLIGLVATTTPLLEGTPEARATQTLQQLQPLLDTREVLEQAGLEIQLVSLGGTLDYATAGSLESITEIRAGVYALLDARSRSVLPELQPAARVLTTVTSRPQPDMAITDAGQKAVGIDLGLPEVDEVSGVTVLGLNAEHCRLRLTAEAAAHLPLGAALWLTPWDIGTTTNLYDFIHVIHHGTLTATWPVAARGHYR